MPLIPSSKQHSLPVVTALEPRLLFAAVAALTGPSTLLIFDSVRPDEILGRVKVRGLGKGESLQGIDFRPATGQLYGVGSSSRLFRIDPTTGVATAVSGATAFSPPLAGTEFGVDFNPAADHLRIIGDADGSFRLDPVTGNTIDAIDGIAGVQIDLSVAYPQGDASFGINPSITAIAHSGNVAGAASTTLFGIDVDANTLVRVGSVGGTPTSPNAGVLTTIGGLGADVTATAGFDIDNRNGVQTAYAVLNTAGDKSGFYTVNLSTGVTALVGVIKGSSAPVRDIAVVPQGERVLVIDGRNRLATLDSNLPNIALSNVKLSGLAPKESIVAVDLQPSSSIVYGFTNQNRLYTIDPATGGASAVGSENSPGPKSGFAVGMDFSPVTGQIRLVSGARDNLRLNPASGQTIDADQVLADTQFDGPLAFVSTEMNWASTPAISAIAHAPNTAGASSATLYAIDSKLAMLTTIGSPGGSTPASSGQVFSIGALNATIRTPVALDIVSRDGVDRALATFGDRASRAAIHSVDLATGQASPMGLLPKGFLPVAMTILARS